MKALIYKDIVNMKKSIITTTLLAIAISIYGIYEKAYLMIPVLCAFIPIVLTSVSFGYDANCNFERMAFSMPIKRSSYVFSKLFFAFLFSVIGALFVFISLNTQGQLLIEDNLLISAVIFFVIPMISAIQLPFLIKFGVEKGKFVMVVTYFIIFAMSSILKDQIGNLDGFIKWTLNLSLTAVCIGVSAVAFLIIAISVFISIRIINKKEY